MSYEISNPPLVPPSPVVVLVRIYEATHEWTTPVWLCDPCAEARRAGKFWKVSRPKLAAPNFVRVIDGACPVDFHDRRPLACLDCGANKGLI